jgi:hypothetical protein
MCWDEKCHKHDCHCEHDHCECDVCCDCHGNDVYNWYKEWDVVWEVDFQIVDKNELQEIKNNEEIWWNLWDDLVKLWFLDEDDALYDEMKKEKRNGAFYTD